MTYDNPESWKQNKTSSGADWNVPGETKEKIGRVRKLYEDNKEAILWTGLILLAVKNRKLVAENRRLLKDHREAKKYLDEAKVSLEALALFDQAFGPRRIHQKHT